MICTQEKEPMALVSSGAPLTDTLLFQFVNPNDLQLRPESSPARRPPPPPEPWEMRVPKQVTIACPVADLCRRGRVQATVLPGSLDFPYSHIPTQLGGCGC